MIHIDLLNNPPSDEWIKKADALTTQLIAETCMKKKKKIIDSNAALWRELKKHLASLSYNKCWYSEANDVFSHYHVEHFRPKKAAKDINGKDKGGYWWLAFNWTNYRLCGAVGNTKKGDKFAVRSNKANSETDIIDDEITFFLDPIVFADTLLISFNDIGEILPISVCEKDWNYIRVKYTIDNLNLNYPPLCEARKKKWNDVQRIIYEVQKLLNSYNLTPSVATKTTIQSKMADLKQMVSKESEFSATASACLYSSGLDWARRIAA